MVIFTINRILLVLVISVSYCNWSLAQEHPPIFDEMIILAPLPMTHESYKIKKNSSVHESLMGAGVDSRIIYEIVKVSKPKFNLRHIQPGTRYTISRTADGKIRRVSFDISALTRLEINHSHKQWSSDIRDIDTTKQLVRYSGEIQDSLWGSASAQGLSPEVIVDYAEVFGWQVDFSREVRKGDRWHFTVEKLFAEGRHVGWGHITYAEFKDQETTHKAYFYKNKLTQTQGYFDEDGQSLRKMFLKSPIKFGRITSGFSRRRFHPIQRRYKAHNGVDYGAPRGTPIRSVGDGRVSKIGRYFGSGKMIVVDHMSGYQTKYLHMSRFKKGMKRGAKVLQGQVIGYVGATGFATGPHLHFEMSQNRRIMDPLKVNLPSSDPVPATALAHFKKHVSGIKRIVASEATKAKDVQLCCQLDSDSTGTKVLLEK